MDLFESTPECQRAEALARTLAADPAVTASQIADSIMKGGFSIEALAYGFAFQAAQLAHRGAVHTREREARTASKPVKPVTPVAMPEQPDNDSGLPPGVTFDATVGSLWYMGRCFKTEGLTVTQDEARWWKDKVDRDIEREGRERDERYAREDREAKEAWDRIMKGVQDDIEDKAIKLAEQMVVEWTADLLASTFALRDGTRVTWADATQQQHRDRIEMLVKQAAGTVETAALHEKALREIAEAGVKRLGDL